MRDLPLPRDAWTKLRGLMARRRAGEFTILLDDGGRIVSHWFRPLSVVRSGQTVPVGGDSHYRRASLQ